ncbi:MAG: GNAT family N-acetyltransferase [Planctomycetaceae bacterium]
MAARQADRGREGVRLVAEWEGQVVATVQFDRHERHVHVIGLAVHPQFQRRGIARDLLDSIAVRARSLGHQVVVLDTIKETGNVDRFEKLGFCVYDERVTADFESDQFPQLHEVRMERNV